MPLLFRGSTTAAIQTQPPPRSASFLWFKLPQVKSTLSHPLANPLLSEIELPFSVVGGYLEGKSAKV